MTKLAPRQTVVVLVLAAVLANSIPAWGQEPERAVIGTWEAIKALPSSDDLTVTLKDGSSKKGKLSNVTDTTLSLGKGKNLAELPRDSIFQIYRSVPRSRKRGAWIGGSVGAILAVLSGVSAAESPSGGEAPAGAIALGIAFTATLGVLIGRGIARSSERVLIYETRR